MPIIYTPVLLLLSETPDVTGMLVDDLIIATLGRALGGFEDIFASAALGKFYSSQKCKYETHIRISHKMELFN